MKVRLTATDTALSEIQFSTRKDTGNSRIISEARKQLGEYFRGKRKKSSVPLFFQGTPFQEKVWKALQTIPYGKTVTYSHIAQKIGNPRAVRAVGTAVGKNPLCIFIPCHRVVGKNGLGGYSGGIEVKKQLLELEHAEAGIA